MNSRGSTIPLAKVLRATNGLVKSRLIEAYAVGGALAAIHYIEPFATYNADIFFIPAVKDLTAGLPAIYRHLQARGWQTEGEHLLVGGFPVQFLAAHGLTEEAVRQARRIKYEGVATRIFRAEHLVAIDASVGRLKDLARIEQMLHQARLDKALLGKLLRRYKLKLPKL